MTPVDEQLIADHLALDKLRQQLQRALANRKLEETREKLDHFWARLAVHIRAEHLHLFPLLLNTLQLKKPLPGPAPPIEAAEGAVTTLQSDHDFFMSELGRAVKIIHGLPASADPWMVETALHEIAHKVEQVSRRLMTHNDMEESQIYRCVSIVLTSEEQVDLAQRISAELIKRPARFTLEAWSNVAK
jgi:hypothetical protein